MTNLLILLGLLWCYGNNEEKAKILYDISRYENSDGSIISATNRNLRKNLMIMINLASFFTLKCIENNTAFKLSVDGDPINKFWRRHPNKIELL